MNLPETYNIECPELRIIRFTERYEYLLALAHTDHFIFHCPIWKDEGNLIRAAFNAH
jgi:hypothetical protein